MKNLSLLLLAASILVCTSRVHAQEAVIQWQKCYGGSNIDNARCIQQTIDGGYIVAGYTYSNDGDISGFHGASDIWVIKIDNVGNIIWQKCLGGSSSDVASTITQTLDDGYIVAGITFSNDGDVTGCSEDCNSWIIKLDNSGNIQWQNSILALYWAEIGSIQQTIDEDYILCGTAMTDLENGYYDACIVKLDNTGNIQWYKFIGGFDDDYSNTIVLTTDGGYIFSGYTESNNGDVSGNHGGQDAWVVKLDDTGNIEWQKCLGGSSNDKARSIQQTSDGGYIVAGNTFSNDGDVSGNHSGNSDAWVIKLEDTGNIQWQKCLGSNGDEYAFSVQKTTDGGFIVESNIYSNNADIWDYHGGGDAWVVKLENTGNIEWQKCLGGSDDDYAYSIQQTTDGGYILAGYTDSNDEDVSGNHGGPNDAWVVKIIESNVSGLVFHDTNLNGIPDEGEQGIAGHLVKLEPGPFYTFTNNEGKYFFRAEAGDNIVSYVPVNYWYATAEEDYQFSVISNTQIIDTLDFGIATRENSPDVSVYLTGSPTRAGFDTHYWISYKNQGTLTTSGTVNVAFDPLLTFVSSTEAPTSQLGNVFTWNYGPMGPGVEHQFRVDFEVPGIDYLGDTLFSHVWITPLDPDTCLVNNYDTIYQEITGSYD
ncbi:MAG TPA: hypothetical protein PLK75_12685, partial [Bacteroidales bacterium]|nr:hypothetical protein [Bacteroidales bacterium]